MMENTFDEESVLSRLKQDDPRAFEAIYKCYWERLFNRAYRHLHDENETKELIQDLFTELWNKRHTLHVHSSLDRYLQSALKYKILNRVKAAMVREKFAASVRRENFVARCPVEEEINHSELNAALQAAIRLLPAQPRKVYELRQQQGLSYAEIANSLRISVSTVEKHMLSAVRSIRLRLRRFRS